MKKTICLMLLCAMLCTAAGCASSDKGAETTNSLDTTAADTTPAETETTKILPDLPERDFEGYTFRGMTKGTASSHWYSRDFYAEEITGEAINDAVYNRNATVGEKYNFKMEELGAESGDPVSDARKAVQAGENSFDVILAGNSINPMITGSRTVCFSTCTRCRTWTCRARGTTRTRTNRFPSDTSCSCPAAS